MKTTGYFSLLLLTVSLVTAQAKDTFYFVPIDNLELTTVKGEVLPPIDGERFCNRWRWRMQGDPRALGAKGVEVYMIIQGMVDGERNGRGGLGGRTMNQPARNVPLPNRIAFNINRPGIWLAIRATGGSAPIGRLIFPHLGKINLDERDPASPVIRDEVDPLRPQRKPAPEVPYEKLFDVSFRLKAGQPVEPRANEAFRLAQVRHYEALHQQGIPGGAWFRYQARLAREELRKLNVKVVPERERGRPRWQRESEMQETYEFFSGGRALSENLQLDRELRIVDNKEGGVAIDSLPGIEVKEMDWEKLIAGKSPPKDPLAGLIPADQHVIFFTSFSSMRSMLNEIDHQGVPVLGLMTTRSEDTMTFDKYGEQLCLPLGSIGKLLGPTVIDSMAFTGSDSYLLTGSDLAVLFEPKDADVLVQAFRLLQVKSRFTSKDIRAVKGKIVGVAYEGVVNPSRTVSAYMAIVGKAVVVSNSLVQLEKIVRTSKENAPSMGSLDEYTFFRNRYPLGAKGAMGFLVITDTAIRRWCSARWRIADSRRTRAAAALGELQAVLLNAGDTIVDINKAAANRGLDWLGRLEVRSGQVVSVDYGSLRFLKPISEMNLYFASPAEARGYAQFRDSYQRQWRQFFDPIAVQFAMGPKRMTADVTVMPLILESEYNEMSNLVGGMLLPAGAGDPHQEAVLQYLMALNMKSRPMLQLAGTGSEILGGVVNPFSWIGGWISIYVDDSPLWERIGKIVRENPNKADNFLEENLNEIPVAFNVGVKSPLRLAAFLTSLRVLVKESAPEAVRWETRKHKEKSYVAIISEDGLNNEDLAIYYAITRGMLTISLNEKLIQQVIERSLAGKDVKVKAASLMPGRSIGVRIRREALTLLEVSSKDALVDELQRKSWDNLPILNEWKMRVGSPVEFHARHWHTRLICPGGGTYRWNEEDEMMESSVFGHPDRPLKKMPATAHPLHGVREVRFGLTFEHDGLRVQGEVLRETGEE